MDKRIVDIDKFLKTWAIKDFKENMNKLPGLLYEPIEGLFYRIVQNRIGIGYDVQEEENPEKRNTYQYHEVFNLADFKLKISRETGQGSDKDRANTGFETNEKQTNIGLASDKKQESNVQETVKHLPSFNDELATQAERTQQVSIKKYARNKKALETLWRKAPKRNNNKRERLQKIMQRNELASSQADIKKLKEIENIILKEENKVTILRRNIKKCKRPKMPPEMVLKTHEEVVNILFDPKFVKEHSYGEFKSEKDFGDSVPGSICRAIAQQHYRKQDGTMYGKKALKSLISTKYEVDRIKRQRLLRKFKIFAISLASIVLMIVFYKSVFTTNNNKQQQITESKNSTIQQFNNVIVDEQTIIDFFVNNNTKVYPYRINKIKKEIGTSPISQEELEEILNRNLKEIRK